MSNRIRYFVKNMSFLTISNFSSKILVFLLVPLYTSVLSTEQYGIYDLVVSSVNMIYPIITLNILDAVMRYLMDKTKEKKDVLAISNKYILFSIPIAIMISFGVSYFGWINSFSHASILILMYYISYIFNQYFIQIAKGLERVREMAVSGFLGTVVMIIANILLLLYFKMGLEGFFLASILSQFVPALYLGIRINDIYYFTFNIKIQKLEKEMLCYCIPLITTTIGWYINSTSDRYIVSYFCGLSANGLLSVSYKIPQIMSTIQNIFIQAWQISAIKEYGTTDSKRFYGEFFETINFIIMTCCSILIIMSKFLANILFSNDFYIAWKYAPFLLISCIFNCAAGIVGPILAAKKDAKTLAKSAIYGACTNVILNIILIKLIGIQGATIATMLSSAVIYYYRKRVLKNEIELNNNKIILICWALLCGQAILEIYTNLWLLQLLILSSILALNNNIIKKFSITIYKNIVKKRDR